jgi:hypothetical protein
MVKEANVFRNNPGFWIGPDFSILPQDAPPKRSSGRLSTDATPSEGATSCGIADTDIMKKTCPFAITYL